MRQQQQEQIRQQQSVAQQQRQKLGIRQGFTQTKQMPSEQVPDILDEIPAERVKEKKKEKIAE